jgi:PKD repeat protein
VHTHAEAGLSDVSLEVANDVGTDSVTRTITVSAGTTECLGGYWMPVVSHAGGINDSFWKSDLGLLGVGTETVSAELHFHGPDGVVVKNHDVAPGAMVNLVDVVSR